MSGDVPLFLYGTLRHLPLLEVVLGRPLAAPVALHEAVLPGFRAWRLPGGYPDIEARPGAAAPGLIAERLGGEDIARLDFYEGGFGYVLREAEAETAAGARVPVRAYFGPHGNEVAPVDFDLGAWERDHAALTVETAAEYMAEFGRRPAGEAAARWGQMAGRSWSRLIARDTAAVSEVRRGPGRSAVRSDGRGRRHLGFFALDEARLAHPTFAGGHQEVVREVFLGIDAALVLPYDPATERVLLVEQFRAGPHLRGDAQPWTLEPVAGLIDPGETPEACALRECVEEAGVTLRRLVPVQAGYPSPGATSEHYHLFVGLADLSGVEGGAATGMAHEGEDILTHVMTLDAALGLIDSGECTVLPLSLLLLWTAAHRARLAELA